MFSLHRGKFIHKTDYTAKKKYSLSLPRNILFGWIQVDRQTSRKTERQSSVINTYL